MNRKFINNTLFYVIGSFVAPATGFLLIPIYTSYLEPSKYAMLNLVVLYTGIFQTLFILSLHGSISSFFYEKEMKNENMRLYVSSLLIFSFFLVSLFSLVLFIFRNYLTSFIFEGSEFNHTFTLLIFYTFVSALSLIPLALLRILRKGLSFLVLNILKAIFQISFVYIFLIRMGLSVEGIITALILSSLIPLALNLFLIKKYLIMKFDISTIKSSIIFSILLLPHTLLSWVTVSFDRIIVQKSIGLLELGVYAVMLQLTSVLYLFYQGINNAYLPGYIQYYQQRDIIKANKIKKYFILLILFSSVIYAGLIQFIAPLILNEKYQLSILVLYILIATQSLKGIYFAKSAYFFARKEATKISKSSIVSALSIIIFSLVLVPEFGMTGAAISVFIAEFGRIVYLEFTKLMERKKRNEKFR